MSGEILGIILVELAWRKNQTVKDDLQNDNWTRGLWRMTTATEMAELVLLWSSISEVQLLDDEDEICWRWTASGMYTSKSAYNAQFAGSFCSFDSMAIWKAKTEDKHRFFAWLLVQCKILTADKLIARSWPCNPICPLCEQELETADHLCLQCVFAQEVWVLVAQWTDGTINIPSRNQELENWWNMELAAQPKKIKQLKASIMICTAWNIWLERNRRIFQGNVATPRRVLEAHQGRSGHSCKGMQAERTPKSGEYLKYPIRMSIEMEPKLTTYEVYDPVTST